MYSIILSILSCMLNLVFLMFAIIFFYCFAGGPRVCIAQRFAISEIKITVAKLLSQFRVVETKNSKIDVQMGNIFFLDFINLRVKFERRDL
jgi:cytochrome P450